MTKILEKTMRLSPIDEIFVGEDSYPVQLVFYYPKLPAREFMQKALDEMMPDFWPLGSVLVEKEEGHFIQYQSPLAIEWDEQLKDFMMEDMNNPNPLAQATPNIKTLPGERLARLKICPIQNGFLFYLSVSHTLVDGFSYFYFLSSFAQKCLGKPYHPPVHQREIFFTDTRVTLPMEAAERAQLQELLFKKVGFTLDRARSVYKKPEVRWELMQFLKSEWKQNVQKLREQTGCHLSDNDVISARVFLKHIQAMDQENQRRDVPNQENEVFNLTMAWDLRRIFPGISPLYFGNAVCGIPVSLTRFEARQKGEAGISVMISEEVHSRTLDKALEAIDHLNSYRAIKGKHFGNEIHVANPVSGLLTTNLSRISLETLNLGEGAPTCVYSMVPAPNTYVILSSGDNYSIQFNPIADQAPLVPNVNSASTDSTSI
jgi:hypothetical protein